MTPRIGLFWICLLVALLGLLSVEAAMPEARGTLAVMFLLVIVGAMLPLRVAGVVGVLSLLIIIPANFLSAQVGRMSGLSIVLVLLMPVMPLFLSALRSGFNEMQPKSTQLRRPRGSSSFPPLYRRDLLLSRPPEDTTEGPRCVLVTLTNMKPMIDLLGPRQAMTAVGQIRDKLQARMPKTVLYAEPGFPQHLYFLDYDDHPELLRKTVADTLHEMRHVAGFTYSIEDITTPSSKALEFADA